MLDLLSKTSDPAGLVLWAAMTIAALNMFLADSLFVRVSNEYPGSWAERISNLYSHTAQWIVLLFPGFPAAAMMLALLIGIGYSLVGIKPPDQGTPEMNRICYAMLALSVLLPIIFFEFGARRQKKRHARIRASKGLPPL